VVLCLVSRKMGFTLYYFSIHFNYKDLLCIYIHTYIQLLAKYNLVVSDVVMLYLVTLFRVERGHILLLIST
jgi:hypothetical protein